MPTTVITQARAWRVRVPLLETWCASPEFGGQPIGPDRLIVALTDSQSNTGWGEGQFKTGDDIRAVLARVKGQPLDSVRTQMLALWEPGAVSWQNPLPPLPYAPDDADIRKRILHPFQLPFETALLDLTAKRADISLGQLWGGIELGFRGVKVKTILQDPNVERLQAIRDAAGSTDFAVTVDPNQRFYRYDDAKSTILEMDKVGNMKVLEDPFPRLHLQDALLLRPQINARLVAHIDDPESIRMISNSNAFGGLNLDSHTVGLQGWRQLAAAADAANLPVWHGSAIDLGIYTAAQLHLAGVTPNCQLPGDQMGPWLREATLVKTPFIVKNGKVKVPVGPGLGVEVDEAQVEKYASQKWQA
jgi:L-alanine-DL-glutamate epimerase-like enolase superfamily enzyme